MQKQAKNYIILEVKIMSTVKREGRSSNWEGAKKDNHYLTYSMSSPGLLLHELCLW